MAVNDANFEVTQVANVALKEALYFYKVLLDYGFFFDDLGTEDGDFSPEHFISCEADAYDIDEEDAQFLREASFVKLVCRLLQTLSQSETLNKHSKYVEMSRNVLNSGMHHILREHKHFLQQLLNEGEYDEKVLDCMFVDLVVKNFKNYLFHHNKYTNIERNSLSGIH